MRMKRQVALQIVTLALLFLALASAENQTVKLGNYTVSFDLGLPKDAYKMEIQEPKQTKALGDVPITQYYATIANKTDVNDFALIVLSTSEKETHNPSIKEMSSLLNSSANQLKGSNIQSYTQTVDGTDGAIVSFNLPINGITKKVYSLMYLPKANERHQYLIAKSLLPSSNTMQFFQTIHVENQK
jgi:hypothetical protein